MRCSYIDEFVHLNASEAGNVNIEVDGLKISIPLDKLTEAVLKSNRGLQRLLCGVYHHCMWQAEICDKKDDFKYANEFRDMAKRIESVVEVFFV